MPARTTRLNEAVGRHWTVHLLFVYYYRMHAESPCASPRVDGFTLIELMVVVSIIGVLAMVAVPAFSSYLQKSRTSEAAGFLGEIKQRQESYRAEFGQYCAVSGTTTATPTYYPATVPTDKVAWAPPAPWLQLGASPDGLILFQYATVAGFPGVGGGSYGFPNTDFWFVGRARADLDGDGDLMWMELVSGSNILWIGDGPGDGTGSHLSQGWE